MRIEEKRQELAKVQEAIKALNFNQTCLALEKVSNPLVQKLAKKAIAESRKLLQGLEELENYTKAQIQYLNTYSEQ